MRKAIVSKPVLRVFFLLALIVLGAGAWRLTLHKSEKLSGSGGAPLATASVERGDIEDIVTAQGTLEPHEYVDVGVQVSGQLRKIYVSIGNNVKQGDLIAEIDPQTYEARVQADEAKIKDLTAQIARQEAEVEKSGRDFKRNQTMMKAKAVSEQLLQDSETAAKTAQAQLDSLKAQLEGAQSTLEGDKANLSYTKIYAPISGTVLTQDPREGQTLNASQTAPVVARIGDLDVLTVRAQVAEADVMNLKTSMPVYFTTLGAREKKWDASIRLIQPSPQIVNQVVLYDVLADVDNKDRRLMTGMSTQMFFVVATARNVPVIPVAALGARLPKEDTTAGHAYKVRVAAGKTVSEKTVHIGLMDRKSAEIKDGLSVGDKVVLAAPPPSANGGQRQQQRFMGGPRL